MTDQLVYTPIFRLRQEEQKVLLRFPFNQNIIPYVEIVKEFDRVPGAVKEGLTKRGTCERLRRKNHLKRYTCLFYKE